MNCRSMNGGTKGFRLVGPHVCEYEAARGYGFKELVHASCTQGEVVKAGSSGW